ncbi:MAG: TIGR01777 family oxidoreductase [Jatrophihabitantaceae bacterium]
MRVVLAGGSGLIGSALRESLTGDGHQVKTLLRHETHAPDEDSWDPAGGRLDPDFLADADAVVCLSGVGVGEQRWSASFKAQIRASRVDSVSTVARTLATYGGPRVLITASAVGFYGDTGDRSVDETAPRGTGFLAEVCEAWEAAAAPAEQAGVRVAQLRTGLVLSGDGGLLGQLKPIVQAGVAGRLGSGRQFMPWISLADEIAAIRLLLEHDVAGPVNLTAPRPVRNADFMRTLGKVLHRPTVLPTPAFALRIVLGEFAQEALSGQRAVPAKLAAAGFTFTHNDLESALRWALGR